MSSEIEDEDDEMADLFSFSAATPTQVDKKTESLDSQQNDPDAGSGAAETEPDLTINGTTEIRDLDGDDLFGPKPSTSSRHRSGTDDSVLDLLDNDDEPDLVVDQDLPMSTAEDDKAISSSDPQEVMEWLDKKVEKVAEKSEGDEPQPTVVDLPPDKPDPDGAQARDESDKQKGDDPDEKKPDPPEEGTPFETLQEAVVSPLSTISQIRRLFVQDGFKVDSACRPALWCRSVCGKTLDQVLTSSIADSFLKWNEAFNMNDIPNDARSVWIEKESAILADRILAVIADSDQQHGTGEDQAENQVMTAERAKRELCSLLIFHYQSTPSSKGDQKESMNEIENADKAVELDPLLPPVACALLSAGIPTAVASVMLSTIVPTFMPLLALSNEERQEAAKSLHTQFYLLACYHLPLLVHHLDRYVPGWHWPRQTAKDEDVDDDRDENINATQRSRNLESQGVIPQSWLISHLAGECGGTLMNPKWLVSLWDLILTSSNNSLRFFFSLALLEKNSDSLLMLTGKELVAELTRIIEFKEGTTLEGQFAIEAEEDSCEQEAADWVQEWCARGRALWESTPRSVTSQLRAAEDNAVSDALMSRQVKVQEEMEAKLEEQAKAHTQAMELEKEKRMEEERTKLTRERLAAFYRKHNPSKEDTVDAILDKFEGRVEVLDAKLKKKYGVGFNPALKPKAKDKNKILSSMNQSLNVTRKRMAEAIAAKRRGKEETEEKDETSHKVTVEVAPAEVLSILCWSKEAAAATGPVSRKKNPDGTIRMPMKFYLIDSRPSETCQMQGRFPTAVNIGPETLLEPDRMKQHEEMFESLRGAVHLCVMGEGFSALPELYGQKITPKLLQLANEDEARVNLCALFFVKQGFPFVSVLNGGFAAAHAWLAREGSKRYLSPESALVDYDKEASLFAQLEDAHREQEQLANATTREKTQHALQNLFDGSLAALTKSQIRLESMAADLESQERKKRENRVRASVSNMFSKKEPTPTSGASGTKKPVEADGGESTRFQNPFASFGKKKEDSITPTESETISAEEEASGQSDDNINGKVATAAAPTRFFNPFAKKDAQEAEKGTALDQSTKQMKDEKKQVGNRKAGPKKSPGNSKSPGLKRKKVPTTGKLQETQRTKAAAETGNDPSSVGSVARMRFSGLGSALNNMKSSASLSSSAATNSAQTHQKRNPFARFGSAAANNIKGSGEDRLESSGTRDEETGKDSSRQNRFANLSMNQFRKRVQASGAGKGGASGLGQEKVAKEEETVEESISFFDNDTDSGPQTPASD